MEIIGRRSEIAELEKLYAGEHPEFVVLYGRRRVGKTFLMNEVFKGKETFSHTALSTIELKGKDLLAKQLRHFTHSLIRYGAEFESTPENWLDAFFILEQFLEKKAAKGERLLVCIDELPWLDTPRS